MKHTVRFQSLNIFSPLYIEEHHSCNKLITICDFLESVLYSCPVLVTNRCLLIYLSILYPY